MGYDVRYQYHQFQKNRCQFFDAVWESGPALVNPIMTDSGDSVSSWFKTHSFRPVELIGNGGKTDGTHTHTWFQEINSFSHLQLPSFIKGPVGHGPGSPPPGMTGHSHLEHLRFGAGAAEPGGALYIIRGPDNHGWLTSQGVNVEGEPFQVLLLVEGIVGCAQVSRWWTRLQPGFFIKLLKNRCPFGHLFLKHGHVDNLQNFNISLSAKCFAWTAEELVGFGCWFQMMPISFNHVYLSC